MVAIYLAFHIPEEMSEDILTQTQCYLRLPVVKKVIKQIRGSMHLIKQLCSLYVQYFHPSTTFLKKIIQIEDHPLVSFLPLDLTSPDSLETVVSHIDYTMQYGEDEEPKEVRFCDDQCSS
jgi:hypothetical protein